MRQNLFSYYFLDFPNEFTLAYDRIDHEVFMIVPCELDELELQSLLETYFEDQVSRTDSSSEQHYALVLKLIRSIHASY